MSEPLPQASPSAPPPELLTAAEVAALLRCSVSALKKRVQRGSIPEECVVANVKPVRFRASAVREWLRLGGAT